MDYIVGFDPLGGTDDFSTGTALRSLPPMQDCNKAAQDMMLDTAADMLKLFLLHLISEFTVMLLTTSIEPCYPHTLNPYFVKA